MTSLQLTDASSWKPQTWISQLPSGKVVELKKPPVFALIADDGSIPDTAFEMFTKQQNVTEQMTAKAMREQMRMLLLLAKTVIPEAIVNLDVIVTGEADYGSGEINLSDIEQNDQIFIVTWALQGGDPELALARFLEQQQGAGISTVQGMPDVLPASIGANAGSEPVNGV